MDAALQTRILACPTLLAAAGEALPEVTSVFEVALTHPAEIDDVLRRRPPTAWPRREVMTRPVHDEPPFEEATP
jgi:hypothetical protein